MKIAKLAGKRDVLSGVQARLVAEEQYLMRCEQCTQLCVFVRAGSGEIGTDYFGADHRSTGLNV